MAELTTFAEVLKATGGYGFAAVFLWLWREDRKERMRYRDLHEETIRSFPEVLEAIKALGDDIRALGDR